MNFVSTRLITDDTKRLVGFYESVTGISATWYTNDFAEISTRSCTLAIASATTMNLFGARGARHAYDYSVIIEFRVDDVDDAFLRLAAIIGNVVQEPTTQPWGNRSLLFRDPDGNLVNLFTPVSAQAIAKHAG